MSDSPLVGAGGEVLLDQLQDATARGAPLAQVGQRLLVRLVFSLLGEHFRVADDLVQRRAQIVKKLRREAGAWSGRHQPAHETAFRPGAGDSSASIFARRRGSSMGFVS